MSLPGERSVSAAGFVLAGGQSRRFGADKARAVLAGEPMLQRMVALLSGVTDSVSVIAAVEGAYSDLRISFVRDRWPGEGPLGGVLTALLDKRPLGNSATGQLPGHGDGTAVWNLIVSCDMPFLTREWLRFLVGHAQASDAQAVVARSAHGVEPLCACWRTDVASVLQPAFLGGMRRVADGLKLLRTEVLDEPVWKRFDSEGRLFWNMNTPGDFEEAKRILESKNS
ncbi:MAG TPA: molybdenum cofactor guanylyltransferase [Candidatus Saccharimonadales bacterium]|nr:molybdenum cofactor guanylyltransferase [Candidatus Saccharimonadales bacterium]